MLWKEVWTIPRGGIVKKLGTLATLGLIGLVLYNAALSLHEIWFRGAPLDRFNDWLSFVTSALCQLGVLVALVNGGGSVTSERESDTWVGLTSTLLSGREIVGAKWAGAMARSWPLLGMVLGLWLLGWTIGAMTTSSVLAAMVSVAVFVSFAGMLGVFLSLCLPTSHRAQVFGVGLMLLMNVMGQAGLGLIWRIPPPLFPGSMMVVLHRLISNRGPLVGILEGRRHGAYFTGYEASWDSPTRVLLVMGLTVLAYFLGGVCLWVLSLRRFEVVAGRARRGATAKAGLTQSVASARLEAIRTSA